MAREYENWSSIGCFEFAPNFKSLSGLRKVVNKEADLEADGMD